MAARVDQLEDAIAPLASLIGVEGAAVVARDGMLLAAKLPPGVDHLTFGAMSATLLGAATTAAYEFRRKPPAMFAVHMDAWRLLAAEAGDALVVAVLDRQHDAADEALRATAMRVRELLA